MTDTLHANIKRKPMGREKVVVNILYNNKECKGGGIKKVVKRRITSDERESFRQEIAAKGVTNFRTEAYFNSTFFEI